jgi:hypothetical protein
MATQRVNGSITVQYPNIGFTLERFYSGVEVYHGTARTCTTARQRFIAEKVMAAVERVLEEEDFTDDEAEAAYWEFENGGEEEAEEEVEVVELELTEAEREDAWRAYYDLPEVRRALGFNPKPLTVNDINAILIPDLREKVRDYMGKWP